MLQIISSNGRDHSRMQTGRQMPAARAKTIRTAYYDVKDFSSQLLQVNRVITRPGGRLVVVRAGDSPPEGVEQDAERDADRPDAGSEVLACAAPFRAGRRRGCRSCRDSRRESARGAAALRSANHLVRGRGRSPARPWGVGVAGSRWTISASRVGTFPRRACQTSETMSSTAAAVESTVASAHQIRREEEGRATKTVGDVCATTRPAKPAEAAGSGRCFRPVNNICWPTSSCRHGTQASACAESWPSACGWPRSSRMSFRRDSKSRQCMGLIDSRNAAEGIPYRFS